MTPLQRASLEYDDRRVRHVATKLSEGTPNPTHRDCSEQRPRFYKANATRVYPSRPVNAHTERAVGCFFPMERAEETSKRVRTRATTLSTLNTLCKIAKRTSLWCLQAALNAQLFSELPELSRMGYPNEVVRIGVVYVCWRTCVRHVTLVCESERTHVQLQGNYILQRGNKIESDQCLGAMYFFQTLFTLKERAFRNSLCSIIATKYFFQMKNARNIQELSNFAVQ